MIRRRHATRDELVELLVPYVDALDERYPDGAKSADLARDVLDALAEMGAPVDALVRITVDEQPGKPAVPQFRPPPTLETTGEG